MPNLLVFDQDDQLGQMFQQFLRVLVQQQTRIRLQIYKFRWQVSKVCVFPILK